MTTDLATVARSVGPRGQFCVVTQLQVIGRAAPSWEIARWCDTMIDLCQGKPRLDWLRADLLAVMVAYPGTDAQHLAGVLRPRQHHGDCLALWHALSDVVLHIGALAQSDLEAFRAEVSALDGW